MGGAWRGGSARAITQRFKPQLDQALVVKAWEELADYYRQVQEFYRSLLRIVRFIIMLVVIFTIVNTMTMAVLERTREIGTLRAIGTQKTGIIGLFLAEGFWIGFFGGVSGILMGLAGLPSSTQSSAASTSHRRLGWPKVTRPFLNRLSPRSGRTSSWQQQSRSWPLFTLP